MKPLSDKQLKKILNRKLDELEPSDSDHLWAAIEHSLPVKSGGTIGAALIKVAPIVGVLTVLLYVSLDAGSYEVVVNPQENEVSGLDDVAEMNASAEIRKQGIEPVNSPSTNKQTQLTSTENKEQGYDVQREEGKLKKPDNEAQIEPIATTKTQNFNYTANDSTGEIVVNLRSESEMLAPITTGIEYHRTIFPSLIPWPWEASKKNSPGGHWFWSGAGYLTYHTLNPSLLDENAVTGDPGNSPTLSDRAGVNFIIGYSKPLSQKLSVKASAGFDMYMTKFYFQVSNLGNPNATIQNKRLDLGLAIGVDYRTSYFLRRGMLGAEIGARRKVVDFSLANEGYTSSIVTYRLTYLWDVSVWKIGPLYSSFITSTNYTGYGKVHPNIYGFMIRRDL